MLSICVLFVCALFINSVESQGLQSCMCVNRNTCYQNLPSTDGSGLIDIRIVTPNGTAVPPTTSPPVGTCSAGLETCCTGPGVTGCGLRYNIPITPATTPGPGQARYGSEPWMAAVLGSDLTYLGGGVLIHPSFVLTAAHKVANRTAANTIVRLGEWRTNSDVGTYPVQDRTLAARIIHEQYNPTTLVNDVALLQLSSPANLAINPAINTICVPVATTNFDNMRCQVSGWGLNAFGGSYQQTLKEVEVPVVPNAECQTRLRTTRLGNSFVLNSASFMCAGGETAKDACIGDGGSPLVCNVGGRYQLAGLVAWGIGCANGNLPGVYVRTNTFLPWIQSKCNCI